MTKEINTQELLSKPLLSRKEAAAFIGVGLNTLDKLDIKRIVVYTHVVRYRKSDVLSWLEDNAKVSVPDHAARNYRNKTEGAQA